MNRILELKKNAVTSITVITIENNFFLQPKGCENFSNLPTDREAIENL